VAPVYSIGELTRDPHFAARGAFVDAHHPQHGRFRQLGPVLAGTQRPAAAASGGDASDADALLRAAGYEALEIAALRSAGRIA
jgi:crotonobetainyl-CoA:carnitine CoA-transferase CaiB-like acyl-CoA transferase